MSDYCPRCGASGNVHDPERHGIDGGPAPLPGGGSRFVRTVWGEKVHTANEHARHTDCGLEFTILTEGVTLRQVCRRCAGRHLALARALGIVG